MSKEDDKKKEVEKEKKNKKAKQGEETKITEIAKGNDKDFKGPGVEGTKSAEKCEEDLKEEINKKGHVTGEDALEILRAKGKKI